MYVITLGKSSVLGDDLAKAVQWMMAGAIKGSLQFVEQGIFKFQTTRFLD